MVPLVTRSRTLLTTQMIITKTGYETYPIFMAGVPVRNPGDVTEVYAQWQLNATENYEVMLDGFIIFGDLSEPTSAVPLAISPIRGIDTYPPGQHYRFNEYGIVDDALLTSYGMPLSQINMTFTVVSLAASTGALPGNVITLNAGYGEMVIKHWSAP